MLFLHRVAVRIYKILTYQKKKKKTYQKKKVTVVSNHKKEKDVGSVVWFSLFTG